MDIDCFLYPGWKPRIRAAAPRRDWMDETPESFAYRCLPLGIANAHGWEIAGSVGFSARWSGGSDPSAIEIVWDDPGSGSIDAPITLFGQGTITFHIPGLFRTPPGWNLWISGPPNQAKDGIAPLSAVVETDWSPYSFTMNWRFTRPNNWVRFEPDEVICFFFPIERGVIEAAQPRARSIDEAPELKRQFDDWSISREAFQKKMRQKPPSKPSEKWQKLYYRGLCPAGEPGTSDHQSKLRVKEFADLTIDPLPTANCPRVPAVAAPTIDAEAQLIRRNWILEVQERLHALSPRSGKLNRFENMDSNYFLELHYSANRPVLLGGEMSDWPALLRWSPAYLAAKLGAVPVEVQARRDKSSRFELDKTLHRQVMPFSNFITHITVPGASNDTYLTAYNSAANKAALAPLHAELGRIDKLLKHGQAADEAMLWIGPKGSFTPLHHDLTNNLFAQIVGTKRILLIPPSETKRMRNREHVFSEIADLLDPSTVATNPDLKGLRMYDITLAPGEMIFIPVGWWHQVTALDFSVSATYTNFLWPNEWALGFQ